MTALSFVRRKIDLTFQLGTGQFGADGFNTVTVTGLRVSATIAGGIAGVMTSAELRVYGLTQSVMNQLSTLGMLATEVRRNSVIVMAGDDTSGMTTVFEGTIKDGWVDHSNDPETVFNVFAFAGLFQQIAPAAPSSYRGPADVAVIINNLAKTMGLQFSNSGVSVILSNSYFPGTAWTQARAAAKAANIMWTVDNGIMYIWPKGSARGSQQPLVSPQTGMVGYPEYTSSGVALRTLFNPSIVQGTAIQVQSSLQPACGTWIVQTLAYNLESETPGGQWFQRIEANRPGYATVSSSSPGR